VGTERAFLRHNIALGTLTVGVTPVWAWDEAMTVLLTRQSAGGPAKELREFKVVFRIAVVQWTHPAFVELVHMIAIPGYN